MRTGLSLLGALFCIVLGFGLGWLSRPLPVIECPPTGLAAKTDESPRRDPDPILTDRSRPVPAGADELAACRTQLAAATALMEAQQLDEYGTPNPFPDDLPPVYRDEQLYAEAVREAFDSCSIEGLTLQHVDCSEYPCIAWLLSDGPGSWAIKDCPSWQAHFPSDSIASANGGFRRGEDGVLRYESIGEWSPEHPPDENGHKRIKLRFDQGRAELMEQLGGREPTEHEAWEGSVAFWRERADRNEASAHMLQQILEREPPLDSEETD